MSIIAPFKKKFWWQNYSELLADYNTLVANQPLSGAGTPTVTTTFPTAIGQIYVDTAASKAYIAKAVTPAYADWMILN